MDPASTVGPRPPSPPDPNVKPLLAPTRRPESMFARLVLLTLLALIAAVSVAEAAPRVDAPTGTASTR
jgi:hypothetical protein